MLAVERTVFLQPGDAAVGPINHHGFLFGIDDPNQFDAGIEIFANLFVDFIV